jgi:hypothetical protein
MSPVAGAIAELSYANGWARNRTTIRPISSFMASAVAALPYVLYSLVELGSAADGLYQD